MSALESWVDASLRISGRSGDEVIADCPWCGGVKLYVNVQKRKFICYRGCARGDVSKLVAFVDGLTIDAAKEKVKNYRDPNEDLTDQLASLEAVDEVDEIFFEQDLPDGFKPCFDGVLWRVPNYASEDPPKGRGLSDDDLQRHGIGYVGTSVFTKWRARLIIPVYFGTSRTFVGRLMGRPEKFSWENADGDEVLPQRYLYPKGADVSKIVYWGDRIEPGADLIVVEGVFDCIRLVGLGFDAIATFGKQMSTTQARLIAELKPKSVTVLYDDDALSDSARTAFELSSRVPKAYFAQVPDGDPDSYGFQYGAKGIRKALKSRKPAESKLDSLELELNALKT
jgi:hypothetical protein